MTVDAPRHEVRLERMFRGWLPAMHEDQAWYPHELSEREYVAQMALALHVEVAELVEEFQWKYWKAPTDEFPVRNSVERIVDEAADVLHFLAHLLNTAGVTEDELNKAMYYARLKNERRQRDGYSY